jgi:hypothetical protein
VFVPGKPFQLSPLFAGKAGAYPTCSTLRIVSGAYPSGPLYGFLALTKTKRVSRGKHSSLFRANVIDEEKGFL